MKSQTGICYIVGAMSLTPGLCPHPAPGDYVIAADRGFDSLLAYGVMKGYSFFTGGNHVGWDVPKGTPGDLLSGGLILPLNICVGIIVACTMYTFYTLFLPGEEETE